MCTFKNIYTSTVSHEKNILYKIPTMPKLSSHQAISSISCENHLFITMIGLEPSALFVSSIAKKHPTNHGPNARYWNSSFHLPDFYGWNWEGFVTMSWVEPIQIIWFRLLWNLKFFVPTFVKIHQHSETKQSDNNFYTNPPPHNSRGTMESYINELLQDTCSVDDQRYYQQM